MITFKIQKKTLQLTNELRVWWGRKKTPGSPVSPFMEKEVNSGGGKWILPNRSPDKSFLLAAIYFIWMHATLILLKIVLPVKFRLLQTLQKTICWDPLPFGLSPSHLLRCWVSPSTQIFLERCYRCSHSPGMHPLTVLVGCPCVPLLPWSWQWSVAKASLMSSIPKKWTRAPLRAQSLEPS